ncbi:hypothetical protein [Streptomyces sp. NPDC056165]|uniref:hypothetical protein n=1 Tax=Streptomyces sp. NPDC056165 TaxID=3345733 RepID=UPI0035DB2EA9
MASVVVAVTAWWAHESEVWELVPVGELVRCPSACENCGALTECEGGEGLVDGQVHWDITRRCAVCGACVVVCGRSDVPGDLRERLLTEHGPARLQLLDSSTSVVVLMKVMRAELGLDLIQVKAMVQRVRAGSR